MLFLYLSLSLLFRFSLLFNLLYYGLDLLSNNLEEDFHINFVSRERSKQFASQILYLITNDCYLLGENFIYF
jgi:hypothetical protein